MEELAGPLGGPPSVEQVAKIRVSACVRPLLLAVLCFRSLVFLVWVLGEGVPGVLGEGSGKGKGSGREGRGADPRERMLALPEAP